MKDEMNGEIDLWTYQKWMLYDVYIHIYMLSCHNITPLWYGPMKPWDPHAYFGCPIIRLLAFHSLQIP